MNNPRGILFIVLAILAALRCAVAAIRAVRETRQPAAVEEILGLAETVVWLRENVHGTIYGCPHDEWPLLHQRLTEMLYPARFQALPGPDADFAINALVVMPRGRKPAGQWRVAMAFGDLNVLSPITEPWSSTASAVSNAACGEAQP